MHHVASHVVEHVHYLFAREISPSSSFQLKKAICQSGAISGTDLLEEPVDILPGLSLASEVEDNFGDELASD
jgi:hypothetical protein